jgi:hypothetical protein
VIFTAMLVSPEKLLVSGLTWVVVGVLVVSKVCAHLWGNFLDAVGVVTDLMVGQSVVLVESGLEINVIMLERCLIEMTELGDSLDGEVILDSCHLHFWMVSLLCHTVLSFFHMLTIVDSFILVVWDAIEHLRASGVLWIGRSEHLRVIRGGRRNMRLL